MPASVKHPSGVGPSLATDSQGRTDVPDVWAAGSHPMAQVGVSAAGAGAWINSDVAADDVQPAVTALRGDRGVRVR